ncbi:MAG TPA: phosphoribosylamine--glycine ligase [Steroidobacteraceae bacterium]|jgi:phosphoribosylamine--glycine ligase
MDLKVLIVGGGGREHALAWQCAKSPRVRQVIVAPGNAGTHAEARVRNAAVPVSDIAGLVELAHEERVDLTIIGPEAPLVAGVVDAFKAAGLACFGPVAAAARLEGSKAYAKDFLQRYAIPSAAYRVFTRDDYDPAWLRAQRMPIVVKASGLAAGKGVVIAENFEAADAAAREMLGGRFGAAGMQIVIEEFLSGEEASFIVMADGEHILPLASSQDHKRLDDGDRGPNTGGMGAYSPAPVVTPEVHARAMREVIEPTIRGLACDGTPYTGFLYAGLMIDAHGVPKVLEFNCRLGDPETQPMLARLRSDLAELCEAALARRLHSQQPDWDPRAALGVVLAAAGYPESVCLGDVIEGLAAAEQRPGKLFHAGTRCEQERVVTSGGRVLCAVGLGESVAAAQACAYQLIEPVHFRGMQLRRDIGYRAIAREDSGSLRG